MIKYLLMCAMMTLSVYSDADSVQFHGFGTLGLATSDQNGPVFLRDASEIKGAESGGNPLYTDSRVGLQADWAVSQRLTFVVQGTYAPRAVENVNQNLQWLFMRYNISRDWTVRVGRVGSDIFALTDQENVGFTYPWVRPPAEVYGFMPIYSMDGTDLQFQHQVGRGTFYAKSFVFEAKPSYFLDDPQLGSTAATQLDFHPVFGGNLGYKVGNLTLRFSGATTVDHAPISLLNNALNQAAVLAPFDPLFGRLPTVAEFQNTRTAFYDVNATYDSDTWYVTTELTHTYYQSLAKPNKNAGYLTIGHYYGQDNQWLPFINFAKVDPTRKSLYLNPIAGSPAQVVAIADLLNTAYFDQTGENQQTWSIGVKYNVTQKSDLKFQVDNVKVFGSNYADWNTVNGVPRTSGVTIFSATYDWVF